MDLKVFGNKIHEQRYSRHFTCEALSEKCDISPGFLRQIEAGKKGIGIDNFVKLCNSLDVSPGYLLRDNLTNFQDTVCTKEEFLQYFDKLDEKEYELFIRIIKAIKV